MADMYGTMNEQPKDIEERVVEAMRLRANRQKPELLFVLRTVQRVRQQRLNPFKDASWPQNFSELAGVSPRCHSGAD